MPLFHSLTTAKFRPTNTNPGVQVTGGTLIDDGAYWVRIFSANSTMTVTGGSLTGAEVFVVGGGGAGGYGSRSS